jgi:hypothetical protein
MYEVPQGQATQLVLFDLVGARFTQEPYGIGLKKGDLAFRGFRQRRPREGSQGRSVRERVGHDHRQTRPPANSTPGPDGADIGTEHTRPRRFRPAARLVPVHRKIQPPQSLRGPFVVTIGWLTDAAAPGG